MINAFKFGAPPHGGSAPGIDRIVMLLADEPNIREVILFPMNQKAEDLMMNAPSEVMPKQLKELSIRIVGDAARRQRRKSTRRRSSLRNRSPLVRIADRDDLVAFLAGREPNDPFVADFRSDEARAMGALQPMRPAAASASSSPTMVSSAALIVFVGELDDRSKPNLVARLAAPRDRRLWPPS